MKENFPKPPAQLLFDDHPWPLRLSLPIVILMHGVLLDWDFWWILAAVNAYPVRGTLIFIVCLGSFYWMTLGVNQVGIDLTSRTYLLRRGIWPFTAGFSGTLEDVELCVEKSHARKATYYIHIYLAWKDNSHGPMSLWSKSAWGREAIELIVPEARLHAQTLAEQWQIPLHETTFDSYYNIRGKVDPG